MAPDRQGGPLIAVRLRAPVWSGLGRLVPWAAIVACSVYVGYSAGRYRVLGIPIPVLDAAFAAALGAAWTALVVVSRQLRLRLTIVVAAASALGLAVAGLWATGRYLGFRPTSHPGPLHKLVLPLLEPRFFAGSPFLVVGLVASGLGIGVIVAWAVGYRPTPIHLLAVLALAMMVLSDMVFFQSVGLRDFRLDLDAAASWLHGGTPYLQAPLAVAPGDPTLLPFLYPPLTLPLFGVLASLPFPFAAGLWLTGSFLAALTALRLFGVSLAWSIVLLLWPAFAEGLYVGNVAVPGLLLFAVGPWFAGALLLGGVFKLQAAIPGLWAVRSRRLRGLLLGVAIVLGLVLVTLPLTGVGIWGDWIRGLLAYQDSQRRFPTLYGMALPALVPYPIYLVLSAIAVLLALGVAGRPGLARFGVASIVASPSLYTHGFLVGLPAFLALRSFWLWVVLALTSTVLGFGWWISIGIVVASWFAGSMARSAAPDEPLHPLASTAEPWPKAPEGETDGGRAGPPPFGSPATTGHPPAIDGGPLPSG